MCYNIFRIGDSMNDKRGFTLTELTLSIALLLILVVLVVPNLGKLDNDTKEKLYESKIKLAKTAAYDYGRDNIDSLTSDCTDVKIGKLIELDYLSGDDKTGKNLINPNTNKTMNNIVICIYYEDNTVKTKIENEWTSNLLASLVFLIDKNIRLC